MSLESQKYGEFLYKQRIQCNIEREQLCKGLFTHSMLGKVESGERYPDKLMRDRLAARMGETGYDYECFLQPQEYEEWEERRNIIDSLDDRELERAGQLLEQYAVQNDVKQKVTRQFWLVMQAQWMELKGEPEAERCKVIEEAVKLTVPDVDNKPVSELLLSVQELNLILEYVTYQHPDRLKETSLELLKYMEAERFDLESRAMLCSKIAFYFCRAQKQKLEEEQSRTRRHAQAKKALEVCTYGIEQLRNHSKAYYAWELLRLKEDILNCLLENKELLSKEDAECYEKGRRQTLEFYTLFDKLYEEYRVPKETNAFTYFYREHEVYCISDVIRARRKMFDVSREELENICGKSTIKRLEKGKTKVQMPIAQKLFERFHLSMEMHRAQIVTEKQEALRLEEDFRKARNQRHYQEMEQLLNQLKEMIPMDDVINRQYVMYRELSLSYENGNLEKEAFIQKAIEMLEYTVPYKAAMKPIQDVRLPNGRIQIGEKYLTNMEATILINIAVEMGSVTENIYWSVLQEYFEWMEKKCTLSPIIGMYGFVMTSVASYLGNMGFYEESSTLNRKIIRELLRLRKMSYVQRNLYGQLWNDRKQKGFPMEKNDLVWRQGLLECLVVDIYCKDEFCANKIRKRLEME